MKVTNHTAERPVASIRRTPVRRALFIGSMVLLASGIACKSRHDAPPPVATVVDSTPAEEPVAPAPVPVAVAPVEAIRPTCDQFTVTENGIGAVEIGDARDSVRTRCLVMSDSTAQNGDGNFQGNLVVGVNGSPLVVEIADGRVNRLAVTDTLFRTRDGLGPGVAVTRLIDLPGSIVLEGQHDLSVVVGSHCGLYFRIPKPATPPPDGGRWTDVVRALPPDTPVERVVVRGCRSPAA
jgi:hypothetical protein